MVSHSLNYAGDVKLIRNHLLNEMTQVVMRCVQMLCCGCLRHWLVVLWVGVHMKVSIIIPRPCAFSCGQPT